MKNARISYRCRKRSSGGGRLPRGSSLWGGVFLAGRFTPCFSRIKSILCCRSGIFHARLRAIELLESARIHLLSALTVRPNFAGNGIIIQRKLPSPSKRIARMSCSSGDRRFFNSAAKIPSGSRPLRDMARIAASICSACSPMSLLLADSILDAVNACTEKCGRNPALYIEFLSSPLPSPFISQNPRQVNK